MTSPNHLSTLRWPQRPVQVLIVVVLISNTFGCGLPSGIFRSRWAMDDREYAQKYAKGASKKDLPGKIKQAADARFMEDASGLFVSGGIAKRNDADNGLVAIDVGMESYQSSFATTRLSWMGMTNEEDWFTGADAGLRIQTPTRLAPFIGIGVFAGAASETVRADDDGKDNDDDGVIDEYREKDKRFSGALASVYPEAGAHFWWNPSVRISTYGRYMVTTEGRNADDWMLGAGIAFFTNPAPRNREQILAPDCDDSPYEPSTSHIDAASLEKAALDTTALGTTLDKTPAYQSDLSELSPEIQELVTGFDAHAVSIKP